MPGVPIMRLFVRIEGSSPFALMLPSNLLPEHYVEIAVKYYSEELLGSRQHPELILLRRVIFKNNDQLLDFRRRLPMKPGRLPQKSEPSYPRRDTKRLYETTHQPEVVKQELIVTSPPTMSTSAYSETEHVIKSISINRLVIKMTDPTASSFLEDVFLDTFRAYLTPQELFGKLTERFEVPPLTRVGDSERSPLDEQYYTALQRSIKLRVVRVLEHWVEKYFFDFSGDGLFRQLSKWVREKSDTDGIPTKLMNLIRSEDRTALKHRKLPVMPGVFNRTLAPSAVLAKYPPHEIARQLTLLTLHVHNAIYPPELIGRQWEGPEAASVPNFIAYRDFVNRVSNWVTYSVVSEKDQGLRTGNVVVLLLVCDELLKLNNWDALVMVHGGITDTPVGRLTSTFAALPPEARQLYDKFDELLSIRTASKALKSAMAASPRPHFPSIVVHLKDLNQLEDLPPMADGMINFLRCIHLYNMVRFLLDGKSAQLDVVPDPELLGVFSFWKIVDEQVLSTLSMEAQPR